jgi:hypothetical protein
MQGFHELSLWHAFIEENPKLDGGINKDQQKKHQPMKQDQCFAILVGTWVIHLGMLSNSSCVVVDLDQKNTLPNNFQRLQNLR